MRDETGTDFFEWVDHVVLTPEHAGALRAAGFEAPRVTTTGRFFLLGTAIA